MDEDVLMSMEVDRVMDLLSQCLSPMEQLQCYLAAQQGFFFQVPTSFVLSDMSSSSLIERKVPLSTALPEHD